jgi:hypothetical protein
MRFLDLDLDFFLNKNAYYGGQEGMRLGSEYQPWSVSRVRYFLEKKCGLSVTVPGRTVTSHDGLLGFWNALIESGRLKIPFEVIHIDAHPDLLMGGVLRRTPGHLNIDPKNGLAALQKKPVHEGNYLTFAVARGWISSLVWVPLMKYGEDRPAWDGDARTVLTHLKKRKVEQPAVRDLPVAGSIPGIPFSIISRSKFQADERFDYMALSKSPGFTPPASDKLIPVIEEYMRLI